MQTPRLSLLTVFVSCVFSTLASAEPEPLDWQRFEFEGRKAFVILPPDSGKDKATPWLLYAPTLPGLPNERDEGFMFRRFLDAGMAIAGIDVGESYGSPAGRALYSKFYAHLVAERTFSTKAALLARSRGGLMLYNWAVENPDKVSCIAGIYPVCNLRSYPGLAKAAPAYGMSEAELESALDEHNPIARLAPLAKAKVPIFHIHGDVDKVVPLEKNSQLVADRLLALGHEIEIEVPEGQGHNMWRGFFECERLIEFVKKHAAE